VGVDELVADTFEGFVFVVVAVVAVMCWHLERQAQELASAHAAGHGAEKCRFPVVPAAFAWD